MKSINERFVELQGQVGTVDIPLLNGLTFSANYIQVGLIVVLLFFLVIALGQFRRRFVDWHLGGFMPGIVFGIIIILGVQFVLFLTGRTVLTELMAWENPPEPIAQGIKRGRERLTSVLGARDISEARASTLTPKELHEIYLSLETGRQVEFQSLVCKN